MQTLAMPAAQLQQPWLEREAAGGQPERVPLAEFPHTVGRTAPADVVLPSARVSRLHAALVWAEGRVCVEDRGSTNGTFVNGERVEFQPLEDGDCVRFADQEFTFRAPPKTETVRATQVMGGEPRGSRAAGGRLQRFDVLQESRRLTERLTHCGVRLTFEPVVSLADEKTFGWRLVDDGSLAGSKSLPSECRAAARLRQLQRLLAAEAAAAWRGSLHLFVPLDALELGGEELNASLESLVGVLPEQHRLVVEIPDGVVCDTPTFRQFRESLARLGVGLAHDGFAGTAAQLRGQAALAPNFLVLCHRMVQGISASDGRRQRLQEVLAAAKDLGCQTIAAGLTSDEEKSACRALGCRLSRGPLFGPPRASDEVGK